MLLANPDLELILNFITNNGQGLGAFLLLLAGITALGVSSTVKNWRK